MGPSIEPWGTPDVTGTDVDSSPSTTTVCVRPSRKPLIHFKLFPLTPYWCNLWRSFSWLTLSKALLKSSSIGSVCLPACIFLARSSTSIINCVSHDLFSLNPCCRSYSILLWSRCLTRCDVMICSMILQTMHVSDIGL